MNETSGQSISSAILVRVKRLRATKMTCLKAAKALAEADGGRIFGVDLIAFAVLNRSISLIDGFTAMIRARNILCAGALLRLQIDNLIRFYACWLVKEPHRLLETFMEGKPLNRIRSEKGNSLTDAYLRSELTKDYPWLNSVYEATSGFIHLSKPHMHSIATIATQPGTIGIGIGSGARKVREADLIEALEAFAETTYGLLQLVKSWHVTKSVSGKQRDENAAGR